jgi:hypothetical protein
MLTRIARKHHLFAAALLAFYFLPLLLISRYDYPSGDDYRTFVRARQLGATGAAAAWYTNWSGRYSSFLIQSFIAARDSWLAVYRVVPAALLVAGFASVYYFVRTLFGAGLSRRAAFTLAAVFYTLLVSISPDPATGFYWLSTNVQYAGAVFASLLTLALFIKLERAVAASTKTVILLALFLLIGFVAGLNELSIIFLASVLAVYHYAPCRDADILISDEQLTVNGTQYGLLKQGDSVTVDHGKVLINDREPHAAG